MTWTKLGDEYPAAARELTDAEFRTHVEALCWSAFRLLDLRIPKAEVRRFAESPDAEGAVKGLAVKGWWEDLGDSWYIGGRFAEWQIERVVAEKRRNDDALRQRRRRMHKAGDHSLCLVGNCAAVTRDDMRDVTRAHGRDGTGPTVPSVPKGQDPDQGQEHSAANSQNRRVHDGPESNGSDAQKIPIEVQRQSPATDRNAREDGPAGLGGHAADDDPAEAERRRQQDALMARIAREAAP